VQAQATVVCSGRTLNRESQATDQLYARALARGRSGLFKSMLTGRSRCLLDLTSVQDNCLVSARRDAGVQTVPIDRIRGSENRVADFDGDFNPVQEHTRGRWLSIATAWYRGRALPPVELVQIGDLYFVRDGHHRISVARALGQQFVEATVLAWDVDGPLPWEEPDTLRETAGIGRLYKRIRGGGIQFRDRVLATLRDPSLPQGVRVRQEVIS
jgi:hypothetical protein